MTTNKHKLLCILPHTRYLAIVIFSGLELRDWMIKNLQSKTSDDKKKHVKDILEKLIAHYGIDTVVIKRVNKIRSSDKLNRIIESILAFIRKKRLSIHQYSLEEIKETIIPNGKSNRELTFIEVLKRYPALHILYNKEKINKNLYYSRIFEAVAIGITHLNKT